MTAIQSAERAGGNNSKVLLATAEALLVMGNNDQAMARYGQALELSEADRLETRLALARLFSQEGKYADARDQIALGFAEARVSDATVITAEDYLNAADVLMSMNDFRLAQQFFSRAQNAGADEMAVAIGMANAHLALGETQNAEALLTSAGDPVDRQTNYDYLISMGNVYRQRQDTQRALSTFARANSLQPDNDSSQRAEMELADHSARQPTDNDGSSIRSLRTKTSTRWMLDCAACKAHPHFCQLLDTPWKPSPMRDTAYIWETPFLLLPVSLPRGMHAVPFHSPTSC